MMSIALKSYDLETDKSYIFELPQQTLFVGPSGRKFQKGEKLRKRYQCVEISTGKVYLFQPNAQVTILKTQ
mgnify:FL=1